MKRALWFLMVTSGVASAAPVKPPAGWTTNPQQAVSLSQQLGAVPHFGGQHAVVTTEVYLTPGASLFVTRMLTSMPGAAARDRDRAATAELDELRSEMARAPKATSDGGDTRAIADQKLLEATQQWHDDGVRFSSRMVIAADAQQLVAVTGECLFGAETAERDVVSCKAALASLDPEIAPASRVELTIFAAPAPSGKPSTMQPPSEGSAGPALLDDGKRPSLAPMQIPQAEHEGREGDRRPIYVGLGLIILAVVFWWNRKNRERLETEFEARGDKPAKPASPDADDLHAAAEDTDGTDNDTKEEEPRVGKQ